MIKNLEITFKSNSKLNVNYHLGSVMQGVMLEKVNKDYVEKMHLSQVHPYSQYISKNGDSMIWRISGLNREASEKIIDVLYSDSFMKAEIRSKDVVLEVADKKLSSVSYNELFDEYYIRDNSNRYVTIEFITPTSFKSDGKYAIFPTARFIINNLIKKYDISSDSTEIYDEMLIEQIERDVEISEYKLRSVKYCLEGVKIPAFIGSITLKIRGAREFICLINMLLKFGEFSSVGIKTSIGMGAYKIIRK